MCIIRGASCLMLAAPRVYVIIIWSGCGFLLFETTQTQEGVSVRFMTSESLEEHHSVFCVAALKDIFLK